MGGKQAKEVRFEKGIQAELFAGGPKSSCSKTVEISSMGVDSVTLEYRIGEKEHDHPMLTTERPKIVCKALGYDEWGRRRSDQQKVVGGSNDNLHARELNEVADRVNADLIPTQTSAVCGINIREKQGVVSSDVVNVDKQGDAEEDDLNSESESEAEGYIDDEGVGQVYYMHVPYLSDNEEEGFFHDAQNLEEANQGETGQQQAANQGETGQQQAANQRETGQQQEAEEGDVVAEELPGNNANSTGNDEGVHENDGNGRGFDVDNQGMPFARGAEVYFGSDEDVSYHANSKNEPDNEGHAPEVDEVGEVNGGQQGEVDIGAGGQRGDVQGDIGIRDVCGADARVASNQPRYGRPLFFQNGMIFKSNQEFKDAVGELTIFDHRDIRMQMMARNADRPKLLSQFHNGVSPSAWGKVQDNRAKAVWMRVIFNGDQGWEVTDPSSGDRYVVNVGRRTCICRSWDLTGIPCAHAMCVIGSKKWSAENYISHWYKSNAFTKTYQFMLQPVPGEKFWPKTNQERLKAPVIESTRLPGRPKNANANENASSGVEAPSTDMHNRNETATVNANATSGVGAPRTDMHNNKENATATPRVDVNTTTNATTAVVSAVSASVRRSPRMLRKNTSDSGSVARKSNSDVIGSKGDSENHGITDYEQHRLRKIAQNKAKIGALGLKQTTTKPKSSKKANAHGNAGSHKHVSVHNKRTQQLLAIASDVAPDREPKRRRIVTRSMT
ncbi:hypothetical protein Tsubulata_022152 [Turnera subulata]|uniref:SWIM-type domain-containing protein n=1 Tax=Turnera subulata TaxID=218843 RepID=A0A9Q0FUT3_9ROSI|nr:hypothetical protein Tsubulata_022152 [Turnera subulata]